jgi:hypothetical protein
METYPPKDYSSSNPILVVSNWNYTEEAPTYAQIADVIGSAPEQLNTLKELADAIESNPLFGSETITVLSTKANDSEVVKLTGAQTITGTKTFTDLNISGEAVFGDSRSDTITVDSSSTFLNNVVIGDNNDTDIFNVNNEHPSEKRQEY